MSVIRYCVSIETGTQINDFLPLFRSHRSLPEILSSSPNPLREDVKRLKLIELQLQDEIKSLTFQRDGLVMELQQLQEAKPMLMQAYTVSGLNSMISNGFLIEYFLFL